MPTLEEKIDRLLSIVDKPIEAKVIDIREDLERIEFMKATEIRIKRFYANKQIKQKYK